MVYETGIVYGLSKHGRLTGLSTVGPYFITYPTGRLCGRLGFHMHCPDSEPVNWNTLVDRSFTIPSEREKTGGSGPSLTGDCRKIDKFVFYGSLGQVSRPSMSCSLSSGYAGLHLIRPRVSAATHLCCLRSLTILQCSGA